MKNYFVQTLCKINKEESHKPDQQVPLNEKNYYPLYQEIQKVSYSTFKHFMEGDWEYILLEEEVNHVFEVFQQNFQKMYDLRQKEECNILFCGLDTTMIAPTEIFGRWDKFMMFNHTDPKRSPKFENNFNCDVRYYPSTMDQKWWDYTIEKMDSLKVWADEQDIYNDMLWGQGVTLEEARHPELSFQAHMMPDLDSRIEEANFYNQFDINDAQIIHWHSSRGIENRLHLMKDVCDRLDVPIV